MIGYPKGAINHAKTSKGSTEASLVEEQKTSCVSPVKIKLLTRRNRGVSFEKVIAELNMFLRGWYNYYKLATVKSLWKDLDSRIRRKLCCYKIKQQKRGRTIGKLLRSLGVPEQDSWNISKSGKGWWRLSYTPAVHRALDNNWFNTMKLISLERQANLLKA